MHTLLPQIEKYIQSYGWSYDVINPERFVLVTTYTSNNFVDRKIPITIHFVKPFIVINTNKMFTFDKANREVLFELLKLNNKTFAGKWICNGQDEDLSLNFTTDIHESFLNQDLFTFNFDMLTYTVDNMLNYIKSNNITFKSFGMDKSELITKESLEFVKD